MLEWQPLAAYVTLVILAGCICFAVRRLHRATPLLPLPRQPHGTWTGHEVVLTFLIVVFAQVFSQALLQSLDFYERFYGEKPSREQQYLWSMLLAIPITIAAIITGLHRLSGTRPGQVGLTLARLEANCCVGYLGFVALSPVVWAINLIATQWIDPRRHPIEAILQDALPIEWALVVLEVIVAVPIYEELVFRGVLQGWLSRAERSGHFIVAGAVLVVAHFGMLDYLADIDNVPFPGWEPTGFAILLVAAYLIACRRAFAARAISSEHKAHPYLAVWGASMLFALVHGAWPSPIPLFVLSLGLGWMAQRTHSLIGPILCHALFNGISCLAILLKTLLD